MEIGTDRHEIVFGREPGVDIEVPFPKVSARHARLLREADGYRLEDLGSSNGTWLEGRRLPPHTPESVAIGESFELGGVEVHLAGETPEAVSPAASGGTGTLARRLVHALFDACPPPECARLVVLSGAEPGRELRLSSSGRVAKLGRGEACDLIISDQDVSREHADFERRVSGFVVRDLGSKNGVEVAGEKVAGERLLRDGDIIRVGETHLRLFDPEDRYLRQIQAAEVESPANAGPVAALSTSQAKGPAPADDAARASHTLRSSRLPTVATAIAATVLLLSLLGVLALAFAS